MSNENKTFFVGTTGYVLPFGELNEPLGKEGILSILIESYQYGTKKYSSSEELFTQLEKLGATVSMWSEYEYTALAINAPIDRLDEAQKLLDHIIEEVALDDKGLQTIKENQLMEIKAQRSRDITLALFELNKAVNGWRVPIGTPESVNSISLADVEELHQKVRDLRKPFRITGERVFELPDTLSGTEDPITEEIATDHLHLIDKDLEQKVVLLGYSTEGYSAYNTALRLVSNCVLRRGIGGFFIEIIREEHSAAYYADYKHFRAENRGLALGYAGTTEKTLAQVVELMFQIFNQVKSEKISDTDFAQSISYAKGMTARSFESRDSILSRALTNLRYGVEQKNYEQVCQEIEAVTKDDILEYFQNVIGDKQPHLVINGKVSEETRSKLSAILNDK